jgi:hypothetical protein
VLLPGVDGAVVAWEGYGCHPQTRHTVVHRVRQAALLTGALQTEPPTRGPERERQDMPHNDAASGIHQVPGSSLCLETQSASDGSAVHGEGGVGIQRRPAPRRTSCRTGHALTVRTG